MLLTFISPITGRKVLIGDNLSSHISLSVLRLCSENNVSFVCLPPNSTHLTQPLDVAFFGPMKKYWRTILTSWRESPEGRHYNTIPKDRFPSLLRGLIGKMSATSRSNLQSGFRKCGIYPFDKEQLLNRLPGKSNVIEVDMVGEAFLEKMKEKRSEIAKPAKVNRRKKINIAPGQSICPEDFTPDFQPQPSTSKATSIKKLAKRYKPSKESTSEICSENITPAVEPQPSTSKSSSNRMPRKHNKAQSSSSDDSDGVYSLASSVETVDVFDPSDTDVREPPMDEIPFDESPLREGIFVLVRYNQSTYPGLVVSINQNEAEIDCMEKAGNHWKWPARKDILHYPLEDIIMKIKPPKPFNKRGFFAVSEIS